MGHFIAGVGVSMVIPTDRLRMDPDLFKHMNTLSTGFSDSKNVFLSTLNIEIAAHGIMICSRRKIWGFLVLQITSEQEKISDCGLHFIRALYFFFACSTSKLNFCITVRFRIMSIQFFQRCVIYLCSFVLNSSNTLIVKLM